MAINDRIKKTIDDIVNEWLDQGRMFSAFEISLAAKAAFAASEISNAENMRP